MQPQSPRTTITKYCLFCQESFEADIREHNRGNAKFCCRSHASKYNSIQYWSKKNKPNVQCSYCNVPFYKNNSKQKRSKSGLFFCCREHKDFAQRIDGIKEIHPAHYKYGKSVNYRKRALKKLPNQCLKCGYDRFTQALVVHHIDKDRSNNDFRIECFKQFFGKTQCRHLSGFKIFNQDRGIFDQFLENYQSFFTS